MVVNKLFDCGKHQQSKISNNFQCLKIFPRCLLFTKMFNHLFTLNERIHFAYNIVEDVVMVNDSVNCLFIVCKLSASKRLILKYLQ